MLDFQLYCQYKVNLLCNQGNISYKHHTGIVIWNNNIPVVKVCSIWVMSVFVCISPLTFCILICINAPTAFTHSEMT